MDWTPEAIERLRALWAEGHSTAEIGRRMGVSKNAVVGKAHRLNLPARPSPIRRDAPADAKPAAQKPLRPAAVAPRLTLPAVAAAGPAAPASPIAATPAVVRPFPRLGAARSCCWPIGEPGTSGFRFCSGDAMTGKPYCGEHAALAYVKARDRREDAA
ncbi:GcrA family cell cycle regulator [Falsiroseomonas sp. CW058]|uniref:GcrA family cell cycle regulator n=1 Tax=Falsiroseomonas sp. CW058 TaxID=3388664 RepID=UPI003D31CF82